LAGIEFTDPRYADRFKEFPLPHPYREVVGMIPPELLRKTGSIRIPAVVTEREYDLVCIASPTWWLSTNVPIRSFLESAVAGQVLKGNRFAVAVICRRYWAPQSQDGATARNGKRGHLHRWRPLLLRRRTSALVVVVTQLSRTGKVPPALSRGKDPADQHQGIPPAGRSDVRKRVS